MNMSFLAQQATRRGFSVSLNAICLTDFPQFWDNTGVFWKFPFVQFADPFFQTNKEKSEEPEARYLKSFESASEFICLECPTSLEQSFLSAILHTAI